MTAARPPRSWVAARLPRSWVAAPPPRSWAAARLARTVPAWAAPALVAAAAAMGCATLLVWDPNEPGTYPVCPFLAMTGRWCPGCGSLRGIRALLTGSLGTAASLNLLMVLALPFLLYSCVAWAARSAGRQPPRRRLSGRATWAVLWLVMAFWLGRNLPGPWSWLAP